MSADTPAIRANKQSMANAMAGNKKEWLALFADDAIVHDPVGPSPHDPEGKGFQGRERISEFWDTMIGSGDLTIIPHKRLPCGDKIVAVVMTAANKIAGMKTYIEMVAVYEVNDNGKLVRLNVYWDVNSLNEQVAAHAAAQG